MALALISNTKLMPSLRSAVGQSYNEPYIEKSSGFSLGSGANRWGSTAPAQQQADCQRVGYRVGL